MGMRAWLAAHRQGKDRANAYRGIAGEGFLRAGVPQGRALIDDIFSALSAAALRAVDVRCPRCAYVGPDEAFCWAPSPPASAGSTASPGRP